MKYIITDIEYSTDGNSVQLPKELIIDIPTDINHDDENEVHEYLENEITNITGFCHEGFCFNRIE